MVTLHEVITFLVSMQISISSLQTHNVNRCGRSRHLARKLSLRRKRSSPIDEIEAGKSYCSRRFGGATCDDKSAQIYARFDKNDWRIQPAEFYRFHDAEVNTFGYF